MLLCYETFTFLNNSAASAVRRSTSHHSALGIAQICHPGCGILLLTAWFLVCSTMCAWKGSQRWRLLQATFYGVRNLGWYIYFFFLGYLFPPSLLGDILVSVMRLQDLTARPPPRRLFKQFWTSQCLWLPRFSQQYPHVEGVWHRLLPLQAGRAEGKHTCWWPVLTASSV